jgi:hypothetical protein
MHRLYRAVKVEELRRLLRAEVRRSRWWRCGLCGRRRLRGLRALERHASLRHPSEYREAVRRALLEVRLRYGRVPRWFAEWYAMSLSRRPTLEKKPRGCAEGAAANRSSSGGTRRKRGGLGVAARYGLGGRRTRHRARPRPSPRLPPSVAA